MTDNNYNPVSSINILYVLVQLHAISLHIYVIYFQPHYKKPTLKGKAHFTATFDSMEEFNKQWVKSSAKKDGAEEEIAKYDGQWSVEEPTNPVVIGDKGLALKSRAKHHAISAKLNKPYDFTIGKPFVVQYEVKFQNGQECGGAYMKLLSQVRKCLD